MAASFKNAAVVISRLFRDRLQDDHRQPARRARESRATIGPVAVSLGKRKVVHKKESPSFWWIFLTPQLLRK